MNLTLYTLLLTKWILLYNCGLTAANEPKKILAKRQGEYEKMTAIADKGFVTSRIVRSENLDSYAIPFHSEGVKSDDKRQLDNRSRVKRYPASSNAGTSINSLSYPKRHVKKQRPGFFWTIAKVTYETFNDTRSAIKQISQLVSENILPDPTTRRPIPHNGRQNVVAASSASASSGSSKATAAATYQTATTTKKPEGLLTRSELTHLVARNIKGLIRLWNIEWKDAMSQSGKNIQQYKNELGKQLAINLKDNPKVFQ